MRFRANSEVSVRVPVELAGTLFCLSLGAGDHSFATNGGTSALRTHWHRADSIFAEIFGFNAEGVIEAGAVVLPRDTGGQFDELRFGELLTQAGEQGVGNDDGSLGHGVGVLEHQPFERREIEIRTVVVQVRDLLG